MSRVTKSSNTLKKSSSAKRSKKNQQPYGELVSLNTSRILLDAVGEKKLARLSKSSVGLLNTSGAIYEANGDYASGFFTSGWCKLLDNASRNLCNTKDNKKALACGKWLCHESCWKASKKSIETKKPADIPCAGGIRLYAVPIVANGKSVGSINFGYQNPPKDEKTLKKLATLYKCSYEELKKASIAYKTRYPYVIEAAKHQLKDYAMLIGLLVEHQQVLDALAERKKELELPNNTAHILKDHFDEPIDKLLQRIIKIVPRAFKQPANTCAQFIYNNKVFKSNNFKKTKHCLKEEVPISENEKIEIEVYRLVTSPIKKDTIVFLDEEMNLMNLFLQFIAEMIGRKKAEKKEIESLQKFKAIFNDAGDGIIVSEPKTHQFVFINPEMSKITGYSLDELSNMSAKDIHPAHTRSSVSKKIELQVSGKLNIAENVPILRKDSSIFYCDVNAKMTTIGERKYLVSFFRDITHRLELENLLRIKSKRIMALFQINQALVFATNEKELLQSVCRILVNIGHYAAAWIGFIENDARKTIHPVATFAFNTKYFKAMGLTWAKKHCGLGPMGLAVRTGKIAYTTDFKNTNCCHISIKQNYSTLISLPLKEKNSVFGILNIYSKGPALEEEDLKLLEEISGDLSYGISMLRLTESKKAIDLARDGVALRLKKSLEDTISIIAGAAEKRDPYTAGHQKRVAELAVAIAKKLNLSDDIVEGIYFGSLIHDLGKIYVPSEILSRPGKLSTSEWAIIKEHPGIGRDIVKNIDFIWPIRDIMLHHHERIDGSGYPEKLKGKKISIQCRIVGVADVVEAMMSHRPYRAALGISAALDEIKKNKGKLYDPKVVDACIAVFDEGFAFKK